MSAIDPGIEEPIQKAANDAGADSDDVKQSRQEEKEYTESSKWWFASTGCPLLAATFGPIANGFSICALVYHWRAYIPPGEAVAFGQPIPDPHWLVAINAVSLVCALIGNATLLLNMARRIKFSIAQPFTITGFFLAGILLVADMAALTSSPTYFITQPKAIPPANHALTSAFYYAIFAAAIYFIIGFLMCLTVYGANAGHYKKDFDLTPAQRTLMLQTMSYVAYLLLGALVFSNIEGWRYLDAFYWAQVTLLTIGLGDYSPQTQLGRGLLFPFALGGILMVGLVVGSIRSLVLERGKEKMSARITEKRRESAINNVDGRKQTIKVSWFAQADFSTDPSLTPAQRREEEFNVMRKVQKAAERERRYVALALSLFFALALWLVGAVIFMICEKEQKWTYFQAWYFTFVVLVTIGYGDLVPSSDAGKAFFVVWSMLAIPSLTILISNMGDTFVKWFSDFTNWIASFTILPEKNGGKKTTKGLLGRLTDRAADVLTTFQPPGLLGETKHEPRMDAKEHYNQLLDRLAARLETHIEEDELAEALKADNEGDTLERDIHFYHYVLSSELRQVQKDLSAAPPKQYSWDEWEYYLRLMGNETEDNRDLEGQQIPEVLVPDAMTVSSPIAHALTYRADAETDDAMRKRGNQTVSGTDQGDVKSPPDSASSNFDACTDGVVDRATERKNKYAWHDSQKKKHHLRKPPTTEWLYDWSWLSDQSPLMSTKTEAEWILERLSAALTRELDRQRKGFRKQPPISMRHVLRAQSLHEHEKANSARQRCSRDGVARESAA